jgi:hypothetical protein
MIVSTQTPAHFGCEFAYHGAAPLSAPAKGYEADDYVVVLDP